MKMTEFKVDEIDDCIDSIVYIIAIYPQICQNC